MARIPFHYKMKNKIITRQKQQIVTSRDKASQDLDFNSGIGFYFAKILFSYSEDFSIGADRTPAP